MVKLNIQLQVEEKSFPIWRAGVLDIPLVSGGDSLKRTVVVHFTNLVSARVIAIISNTIGYGWQTLYLNGVAISPALEPAVSTFEKDVTNLIAEGDNLFVFSVTKVPLVGWGTVTVTANLVLEGEDLEVVPPSWWDDLVSWVKEHPYHAAGVAGGGMAVAGLVIYFRKKRRPNNSKKKVNRK